MWARIVSEKKGGGGLNAGASVAHHLHSGFHAYCHQWWHLFKWWSVSLWFHFQVFLFWCVSFVLRYSITEEYFSMSSLISLIWHIMCPTFVFVFVLFLLFCINDKFSSWSVKWYTRMRCYFYYPGSISGFFLMGLTISLHANYFNKGRIFLFSVVFELCVLLCMLCSRYDNFHWYFKLREKQLDRWMGPFIYHFHSFPWICCLQYCFVFCLMFKFVLLVLWWLMH